MERPNQRYKMIKFGHGSTMLTERGWDVYRAAEIRRRHKIDFSPEQFNWAVKRWKSTCFLTGKTREQGGGAPSESVWVGCSVFEKYPKTAPLEERKNPPRPEEKERGFWKAP